jgi:23S rRNA (uracil1939-C5)-methyltransferase
MSMASGNSPANAPVKPQRGDLAEAQVESIDYEGHGVAHLNGKAVFIDGALPGETVVFRYHNKKKTHDTGRVVEVLHASPDRVTPRCAHYGVCGGCSLQHLRPAAQLKAKQQVLRDALARIGKVQPDDWLPPLEGQPWGYRRRARLGVKLVPKKGGVLVGFREKRSAFITPLTFCEVLDANVAQRLPDLKTLVEGLSCADRLPQIEVAAGDNAIALVFRHLVPLTADDHAALTAFGRRHTMQIWLQPGGPDSIAPLWPAQPEALVYRLPDEGVEFEFAATDFIQVNADLNRRMVRQALALLDLQSTESVLDLFCGLGNFSLPLARHACKVLGIEGDARLIHKARSNAARNAIANVEFIAADLHAETGADPWGDAHFDKWLLDPPRTGAIEVIRRLVPDRLPARIVYVSCNPATLARDAQLLVHVKGYRLTYAGAMDMFPQTSHVEAMAVFDRA